MRKKRKNKVPSQERYRLYEEIKKHIIRMNLSHSEYEERINRLAKALGV